jgi:hypothetical protein
MEFKEWNELFVNNVQKAAADQSGKDFSLTVKYTGCSF